jgi:hypothetical protein
MAPHERYAGDARSVLMVHIRYPIADESFFSGQSFRDPYLLQRHEQPMSGMI